MSCSGGEPGGRAVARGGSLSFTRKLSSDKVLRFVSSFFSQMRYGRDRWCDIRPTIVSHSDGRCTRLLNAPGIPTASPTGSNMTGQAGKDGRSARVVARSRAGLRRRALEPCLSCPMGVSVEAVAWCVQASENPLASMELVSCWRSVLETFPSFFGECACPPIQWLLPAKVKPRRG
jgi:hypothetical protein